jgi:hypothetical protein
MSQLPELLSDSDAKVHNERSGYSSRLLRPKRSRRGLVREGNMLRCGNCRTRIVIVYIDNREQKSKGSRAPVVWPA